MSLWTAERIEQVLADWGVTVTKRGALKYLASLIKDPRARISYQQDNVVIWKPGMEPKP
jgi:hypothetical protein